VPWPQAIAERLSGLTRVRVEGHLDGVTWFEDQQAQPPVRHHPREPDSRAGDASAGLEGRPDVRGELQGLGSAAQRQAGGVDVFGSFYIGDHFHVMATLRGRLDRDRVTPSGSIDLEGVELPASRDVEAFLAFTYGPG